ncbi:MAG: pyridoxamine 5-phosphate oxidase [Novosphingobium sp.]|nr:MAG: pyridoxamine 5-phosphate oxidase [Novosphingobium sp.]
MNEQIDSVDKLEAVIGKRPPVVDLKVIDHLDETALRWLAASPLAFVTTGDAREIAITLAGGAPGFATGDRETLRLPLATIDDPALLRPGAAFASLFLAPGIGETLRINGTVTAIDADTALVRVEECYGHCAKALIRSDFWSAGRLDDAPATAAGFVDAGRFLALATIDDNGHADLSPKGDPAGCMTRMDGAALWFADRPGNRRTDSFRNLIAQPRMAGALLIPGSTQIVILRGEALLTSDAAARERFTVRDKAPLLAVRVAEPGLELRASPALERAALWPAGEKAEGIDPARMFTAHVKLNKDKGLTARLGGLVMSIPGLMQKGLDSDYKNNLY